MIIFDSLIWTKCTGGESMASSTSNDASLLHGDAAGGGLLGAPPDPKAVSVPPPKGWDWGVIVTCVFAIRIVVAVAVLQTSDVPDEWYQSTEVAYNVVFRGANNDPTMSLAAAAEPPAWEWAYGLRSFLYPLPIAALFTALKWLHIDTAWLVYAAPRFYAGVVCACIDLATMTVANQVMPRLGTLALIVSLSHWNIAANGCRTLTNAAEALVLLIAVSNSHSFSRLLVIAAVGCVVRPTVVLSVGPLVLYALIQDVHRSRTAASAMAKRSLQPRRGRNTASLVFSVLLRKAIITVLVGCATLAAASAIDWLY